MSIPDALMVALIALAGLGCQWLAWRVKLPAIVFLLLTGILAGPISGILNPDQLLGDLLFPFVSLAIAIILFEGSLTLHFNQTRDVGGVVWRLVSIGAVLTWGLIAFATHTFIGLSAQLSALFGALVVVTGPTVIVPMLRTLRATERIANTLRWEGILIDPVGALMAVVIYEWIVSGHMEASLPSHLLLFGEIALVGTVFGVVAAAAMTVALRRYWLPEYLHAFGTLSVVLITFTLANQVAHESGLLAVTVMGIWLANARGVHVAEILTFKEHLTVLLISALFIILAARMDLQALLELGIPALMLLACIQFIIRPLVVFACALGSDLSWQEKAVIAWVGPRGIIAAAVSALFALKLEQAGYEEAQLLTALAFSIIIGTVIFQSATARFLATRLGVTEPEPRGVLIIGANLVARAIAKALEKHDIACTLVDPHYDNIRAARMEGLSTLLGNPLSGHIEEHLALGRFRYVLAATPQHEANALACLHFKSEFAERFIFSIKTERNGSLQERAEVAEKRQGQVIGEHALGFQQLAKLIAKGAAIRTTQLTSDYTFQQWREAHDGNRELLAAFDPNKHLHFVTPGIQNEIGVDWLLLSLELVDTVESTLHESKPATL
ncbi:sodium:proton antiporter [Neptunomonas sp. XY-337]|uniref:cation:proton antiporter n=1 Tax=Neptunomonas sp. XY-337 TaxID=2561897 RepID=UPI0010A9FA03|nr:sodium:proton antiporter [Neptunomonas sp. XY-337]